MIARVMMLNILLRGSLVAMVLILVGCGRPQRIRPETMGGLGLVVANSDSDRLWAAAEQTLRSKRYPIDRLDRRNGVITTLPELSQHWFEFWRHDVATVDDWAEASLNNLCRWVQVSLVPVPADGAAATGLADPDQPATPLREGDAAADPVRLAVVVYVERLSSPDRQFNSSGAAFQAFGSTLPSTTGAVRVTPKDDRWVPLRTDPAMAEGLLAAIAQTYQRPATPPPRAGSTGSLATPMEGAGIGPPAPFVDP